MQPNSSNARKPSASACGKRSRGSSPITTAEYSPAGIGGISWPTSVCQPIAATTDAQCSMPGWPTPEHARMATDKKEMMCVDKQMRKLDQHSVEMSGLLECRLIGTGSPVPICRVCSSHLCRLVGYAPPLRRFVGYAPPICADWSGMLLLFAPIGRVCSPLLPLFAPIGRVCSPFAPIGRVCSNNAQIMLLYC